MKLEFSAIIKQSGNINGAFIEPPFNVQKVYGAKRVKVLATFDGLEYRGSLVTMGGCYMLGMTQEIRKKIGKDFGDMVQITIEQDVEERTVEIPDDFQEALNSNEKALKTYGKLSFTKKKEYITSITNAKKAETRINRIEKAIEKLQDNKALK